MEYFKRNERKKERLNNYINKVSKLPIKDLEILLSKIYYKNNHTFKNGVKRWNVIPNIEYVIINFIEKYGKDASYEYNMNPDLDNYIYDDYFDISAFVIKTNKKYWVSSYIMGKTWFEPFSFEEFNKRLKGCKKCNRKILYSELFHIVDYSNKKDDPITNSYCEYHYNKIKKLL